MDKTPDVSIGGIVAMTTIDYPGFISSVIFFQGCPWKCRYCHNKHLQSQNQNESLPWEDVLYILKERKDFIEGVVLSGGEPLVQPGLLDVIKEIKSLNLKVALHTSGSLPKAFQKVISYIDWVGFDIKHSFHDYHLITGIKDSGRVALESLKILLASNVNFEARMTLDPVIDTLSIVDSLKEISSLGVRTVALQKYRNAEQKVIEHEIFSNEVLLSELAQYFDNFYIRE